MSLSPSEFMDNGPVTQASLIFATAIIVTALLIAAWNDHKSRTIPDLASLAIFAAAFLFILTLPSHSLLSAFATGAVFFGFGFLAFQAGWLGGGDIKLMTALSFLAGPDLVVPFLAETAIAGGILTLVMLGGVLLTGAILARRKVATAGVESSVQPITIPYGIAIAVGGFFLLARLWQPLLAV